MPEEKVIPPFRMIGNLCFVGTYGESCHILDIGDGLIMIDTGYERTVPAILEGMNTLGLRPEDIKIILHSHGHSDHTGGTPSILKLCGAKTYLRHEDLRYISGFEPDLDYEDGGHIRLGNADITVLHTPGHTDGTVSFFFNVTEGGRQYRCGMFGGAGTKQLKRDFLLKRGLDLGQRDRFFASIERLKGERVDVLVGNHSWHNHTFENSKILLETGENRFINPARWQEFLCECEESMRRIIESEVCG